MTTVKGYGQFCAVARALDQVGDRWTLLVVRELLLGPRGWTELRAGLPGIATNLLAQRLERMQRDGLVVREAERRYALTPRGRALEPVLHALVRWGAPLMTSGPGDAHVSDAWAVLALDALLRGPAPGTDRTERTVLRAGATAVTIVLEDGWRRCEPGRTEGAQAELSGTLPQVLASAALGAAAPGVEVEGDPEVLARALT